MATEIETVAPTVAAAEKVVSIEEVSSSTECRNCGALLEGKYCHRCGQKRIDHHEFALKHFFGHLLHEITHLDSNKIFKTIWALLFRPGLLTEEYVAGRKGRYINPIRIYLTISAIYFLFAWGPLLAARSSDMRMNAANPRFVATAARKGLEPAVFAEKVMQKAEKYSAILRFASVLLSGLFLSVLYFGMKKYYVEHLIFSLHYYSFDFLYKAFMAVPFVVATALGYKLPAMVLNIFYPVAFIYLLFALRRVYKESWTRTGIKAVVLFACETALFMLVMMAGFIIAFIKA